MTKNTKLVKKNKIAQKLKGYIKSTDILNRDTQIYNYVCKCITFNKNKGK